MKNHVAKLQDTVQDSVQDTTVQDSVNAATSRQDTVQQLSPYWKGEN